MKRIVIGALGLILLGVGCAELAEPGARMEKEDPAVVTESAPPQEPPAMMEKKEDLTLQAEALGGGQVKFIWEAPAGLTEANRFILVQGTEKNPTHDGAHDWFRQYFTHREVVWGQISSGPRHFRICLTENNDGDMCVTYSNDVLVEVK